jgi:hypothetical protein
MARAARTVRITIPYSPRAQFKTFHARKQRWCVLVAHRRAGKTVACINDVLKHALSTTKTDARFAYVAPTYTQAKAVAWDYLRRYAGVVPGVQFHETELRCDLPNGARIRLYGADNPDSLRGIYLDGVILDEYGDSEPRVWSEVLRPALSDRKGWAVFIGTPRGRNHFADLYEAAGKDSEWLAMTLRASETGLLDQAELAAARRAMDDDTYAAEFECSFAASAPGAYYARHLERADADRRIGRVPHEPGISVHTAWDLGIGDSTAIWSFQLVGREIRVIDYIEAASVGLDWYVNALRAKPYAYGQHILPHDVEVKELGTGRSRLETLRSLGIGQTRVIPAQSVDDGINAVRQILGRCWFDAERCAAGIKALRAYRSEWDSKRQVLRPRPLHDWSSHAADAMRYLALGLAKLGDATPAVLAQRAQPIKYPTLGVV